MKPPAPPIPSLPDRADVALRVADQLADAIAEDPRTALHVARRLSDHEIRLGLDFVTTVLEVATGSARALAAVLAERSDGPGRSPPMAH